LPIALGACGALEPLGDSVEFRELAAAELQRKVCLQRLCRTTVTDLSHARVEP
jgi:hypothetical protein